MNDQPRCPKCTYPGGTHHPECSDVTDQQANAHALNRWWRIKSGQVEQETRDYYRPLLGALQEARRSLAVQNGILGNRVGALKRENRALRARVRELEARESAAVEAENMPK